MARRVRGIGLSELRMLDTIGLCNEEGWTTMTELSVKDSTSWLSEAFDQCMATSERKGDVVAKGFALSANRLGEPCPA